MSLRRRLRASAGQLGLVALLTFLAAVLLIGAPRVANRLTDEALRSQIGSLGWQVRDLTYTYTPDTGALTTRTPRDAPDQLGVYTRDLPPQIEQRVQESWWTVSTVPEQSFPRDDKMGALQADYSLRAGSGQFESVRVVSGRLPNSDPRNAFGSDQQVVEVVLTESNAERLGQRIGSQFLLAEGKVRAVVVGIVAPLDENDAIWPAMPYATKAFITKDDTDRNKATYLTDMTALSQLATKKVALTYEYRFRLDLATIDMSVLPTVVEQLQDAREVPADVRLVTSLDTVLSRFADEVRAGQALLAIVQAGTIATLAGLVLLAAQLAVGRRRSELTLLRARGASLWQIGLLVITESVTVVPLAALAGWLVAGLLPGRPDNTVPLLAGFAAAAMSITAVLAMLSLRQLRFTAEREDVSSGRIGLRRRTAELSVLVLAVLGVWLLRRRGVSTDDSVDVFLVSVPVLFAAGAAVLAMRTVPAPLGWSARLAARGRGTVAFLGLARAGRAAASVIAPVAVLVIAVCTTVFSIAVSGAIDTARDQATSHLVPGTALLQGGSPYDAQTTTELRAVPGVSAVAPFTVGRQTWLRTSRELSAPRISEVYLLVVDAPTFAEISAAAGRGTALPAALTGAGPGATPPAVISPAVAADLAGADTAAFDLQSTPYDFVVADVVTRFPMIDASTERFVVLPWQAMPAPASRPLEPSGFLLGGAATSSALEQVGNAGLDRWMAGSGTTDFEARTEVITWDSQRRRLEQAGINGVLTFAYAIGTAGGLALALVAVGFAVLAGARTRGRVLSRLRTMGLSRGQGRRLLLVELAPVVTLAVLTGALVGVALPFLIGPALRLTAYTGGWEIDVRLDPRVLAGTVGLVLAGLATAVGVETMFHRRQRLGEVLRLGEES